MYDDQIHTMVKNRKQPKTYTSGPNHWKKFRSRRGKPTFLDPSTPLENEQEIIRFITYCMITAPNINKWATVTMYLTQIKHMHKEAMFHSTQAPYVWPSAANVTRISIFSKIAKDWFDETDQPSGGRLPTTLGVLQMIYDQLDMDIPDHRRTWMILLLGRIGGIRTGEVVAYVKDPAARNARDTKKLFKRKHVVFGTTTTLLKVIGKVNGETQTVLLPHDEVDEIVKKFGTHFDIIKLLHEDLDGEDDLDQLMFQDDRGKAFTYNNFMTILEIAVKKAGLPRHCFGGHSGRIALATILGARGVEDSKIMKRGRWKSLTFLTYVRALHVPINTDRIVSFRIADLTMDIRDHGFPDVYEFTK
jgi:hypothetical protein